MRLNIVIVNMDAVYMSTISRQYYYTIHIHIYIYIHNTHSTLHLPIPLHICCTIPYILGIWGYIGVIELPIESDRHGDDILQVTGFQGVTQALCGGIYIDICIY
mgnify:FL=1